MRHNNFQADTFFIAAIKTSRRVLQLCRAIKLKRIKECDRTLCPPVAQIKELRLYAQ
ncbi:hypothetical protein [Iningainema tapete]|uniref:Uncharacterized protein n=1 Tax=Iningainema tapete BLCC-T55 TaxID=2748662 RepID=A0A8J6XSR8_9CYAN|nr:hypothetical protein [Iningainema tapete]MBD2778902.1 hypothetical protein [Iningainema tapete BLCC-T55]